MKEKKRERKKVGRGGLIKVEALTIESNRISCNNNTYTNICNADRRVSTYTRIARAPISLIVPISKTKRTGYNLQLTSLFVGGVIHRHFILFSLPLLLFCLCVCLCLLHIYALTQCHEYEICQSLMLNANAPNALVLLYAL